MLVADFFDKITSGDLPQLITILAVLSTVLIAGVVSIVAKTIHRIRRDEAHAQLKHEMLNRGMSADEIKTVLEAGAKLDK